MELISKTVPRINPTFPIFEPITFPTAILEKPSKADFMLTISSGAEVAMETTVNPIIILEIFNLRENPTDAFKSQSAPKTNNPNPTIMYKKFIYSLNLSNYTTS